VDRESSRRVGIKGVIVGEQRAARDADASTGLPRDRGTPPRRRHTPVLLDRCLELLGPALDPTSPALAASHPVHVDATLGLGGHAAAVLERFPNVRLIGLDRDPQALELARERLAPYDDRVVTEHANFDHLATILHRHRLDTVDTVLFDLGVSSMQLDDAERGFAYSHDAPLDMRMDPTGGITAEQVVNEYPPAELVRILRMYGEERFAQRIVAAILRARSKARITGTAQLAELVRAAIPAATRRTGGHPAKRSFQALRIAVNDELGALEAAIPAALDVLAVRGRIVVLAYQSLEDRIVKRAFASRARSASPVDLPVELPGSAATLRLLTRGAETASADEIAANPRAAPARLRAAERIEPAARRATAIHQPGTGRNPSRGNAAQHRSQTGTDDEGDGR
jgi:16S rRNA (cytosine1402-N4)-methyltransferase